MRGFSIGVASAVMLLLISTARATPVEADGYVLTDIGTLPAPYNAVSFPDAINNNGQVLIDSGQQPSLRPAIYTSGSLQNLGTLPASYNNFAMGTGLNDLGQACGTSWSTGLVYHAFGYSSGVMTDLGTLPGYTYASQAQGINNAGQIVGESITGNTTGSTGHAFLYSNNE